MKKGIVLGLILLAGTYVLGQTKPKTATTKPKPATSQSGGLKASIKSGSEAYVLFCLSCHQADGSGVPKLNPPLIKTKWVLGDKKKLIGYILKGLNEPIVINDEEYHNPMPPQAYLTDQQIADILTYVRNSFGNKASAVTPAEVKNVRASIK
jgi:mono/diheme cytochrome c family protein